MGLTFAKKKSESHEEIEYLLISNKHYWFLKNQNNLDVQALLMLNTVTSFGPLNLVALTVSKSYIYI